MCQIRPSHPCILGVLGLALALLVPSVSAAGTVPVYSASFSCGTDLEGRVYETVVDVLNFSESERLIIEHLALSNPEGHRSTEVQMLLSPGRAHQLTCADILAFVFPADDLPVAPYPDFAEGFLVIKTSGELVVKATRSVDSAGDLELDVERVPSSRTSTPRTGGKVAICHVPPGNPSNAHTIWVGQSAVNPHLSKHGDTQGACF